MFNSLPARVGGKCPNTPGDTTNSELSYKCLSMLVIGPQSRCLWLHWGGGQSDTVNAQNARLVSIFGTL